MRGSEEKVKKRDQKVETEEKKRVRTREESREQSASNEGLERWWRTPLKIRDEEIGKSS